MADRHIGYDARLLFDVAGAGDEPALVTVFDAYGVLIIDGLPPAILGDGRYEYIIPAALMLSAGVWTASCVTENGKSTSFTFTVGQRELTGMTLYDLRHQVINRVSDVEYGIVSYSDGTSITDSSLIGGSDKYRYWWVLRGPETADAGRPLRVVHSNAEGLELSDAFLTTPDRGEPFTLMSINPREADAAIRAAITELAPLARIEVHLPSVPNLEDEIVIPHGITHVSAVYDGGALVAQSGWTLVGGRRLTFTTAPSNDLVTVIGLRDASLPRWEDSIVETDEASTIARAAQHLHASKARGQGLDQEEHLRRQLAAQDEYERAKRNSVGRIPPGTRPVRD